MFDVIDEDLFADAVAEIFCVLDKRYIGDLCKELLPRLQATFDAAFETRFVILNAETGKPISTEAVLTKRESAEEFLAIVGNDKHTIGILLIER